jgi:hypothetical protein
MKNSVVQNNKTFNLPTYINGLFLPHSVPKGKASLNLKGTFGVTNLKVCSQKIVPIFSFFFVWAGSLWALVTSPDFGYFNYGPEKLPHSVPKGKGKFFRKIYRFWFT